MPPKNHFNNTSDQAIIESIRLGDETHLKLLYRDYRTPFIQWAAFSFKLNEEEATDIFQDVVIIFYRNVSNGKLTDLSSSIKTYLFGIGKNLIKKHFRDRKLELANVDNNELIELFDLKPVEKERDEHRFLQILINGLGSPCKEIIELFYYRSFVIEAIKNKLGYKDEAVVRTQKKRCMQYLRKAYFEWYKKRHG